MDKRIYELHAETCKALSHPLRIEVIDILQGGELRMSELLERTGSSKSNLSQQLSQMVSKGILVSRREGKNILFSLSSPKVAQACTLMREVLLEAIKRQNDLFVKEEDQ